MSTINMIKIDQLNTTKFGFDLLPHSSENVYVSYVTAVVINGMVGAKIRLVRDQEDWMGDEVLALLVDLETGENVKFEGEDTFTKPMKTFYRAMGMQARSGDWKNPIPARI